MKIVITDAATVTNGDLDLSCLNQFGEVVVYDLTAPEELISRIRDADMVLCNKAPMTADVFQAANRLKYIGLFATGYNNIDIEAARQKGITVCNAGSYSTDAVAQEVFAFILHHASRIDEYNKFVQQGRWIQSPTFSPFVFDMTELSGKTLGIFGFGSIGKAVARIATAFGMKVLVTTRTERLQDQAEYRITYVPMETLLQNSDFITVHCPLTEKTARLFDKKAFSQMKKGCYFINTSRGGVIHESDLVDAVKNGALSGAALDVLTVEPMAKDCPLLNVDRITITPHIAWAPLETRRRLLCIVADNIRAFLDGHPIHVVS